MKYYPLRPIQRWLVDTHFNKAKSTMMNIGGLYKLSDAIDVKRFEEVINAVLNSLDIFRCRFVFHPETSELCQHFEGEVMPTVVEEWTDEEFKMIKKYLLEPYDLIDRPLYRMYIFKTPSANYFYADFYHAIIDGVASSYLLVREIDGAYRGRNKKKVLSYAEYVEEEAATPPEKLAEGQKYWRNMLKGFDERKHLPPATVECVSAWTQGNFDYEIKNLTEEFFRESHLQENNYFLGACMLTLAKITGSKESIMSWIHNGRTNMHERRMIGLMLEQYPCAFDFHEDISVEDFLNRLMGQIQTGMTYRKSLDVVYNEGLEDNCVSFIFQKYINGDLKIADTTAEVIYLPPNEISAAENAIDIEIEETDRGFYNLFLDYDASRYSEKDMQNFAQTMDNILLQMRNPKRLISSILG